MLAYGVERININWNIINKNDVNSKRIISEIFFPDLMYSKYSLGMERVKSKSKYSLLLSAGNIKYGTVTDIDYGKDDRSGIYNIEKFNIYGSSNYSVDFRFERQIPTKSKTIFPFVSPQLTFNHINIPIQDNEINLSSYFKSRVTNIGANIGVRIEKKVNFQIKSLTNLTDLKSEGYWNLRNDLKKPSFKQSDLGFMYGYEINGSFPIKKNNIGLIYRNSRYIYRNGKDITHTTTADIDAILNQFNRHDYSIMIYFSRKL